MLAMEAGRPSAEVDRAPRFAAAGQADRPG